MMAKKTMIHRLYLITDFCAGKRYSDDRYVDAGEKAYYEQVEEQAYNYIDMLENSRCSKAIKQEIEDFVLNHNYWEI